MDEINDEVQAVRAERRAQEAARRVDNADHS
jgi:hypothetical protein